MAKAGRGKAELREARAEGSRLLWIVGLFSMFVNLLMLTGPIFMLQVYDRVLGSRSEETLVSLAVLVAMLYFLMGILDYARGRVAARVGARFQSKLDSRVFNAQLDMAARPGSGGKATGLRDLEAVQKLLASPALLAMFDIPWTPIYLAAIFLFHQWLGIMALVGGAILVVIALSNQQRTRKPLEEANGLTLTAERFADKIRNETETINGLGMRSSALNRWQKMRESGLEKQILASDYSGTFTTGSKTFRLFLQSAMLALGAYLVLQGDMTAGAMIAASILMGRALAPIEQTIGQWPVVQRAMQGWRDLSTLLDDVPTGREPTRLPDPKAVIEAKNLTIVPPGTRTPTLRGISFRMEPGQAMGVIGPSGAGKSTLARAVIGVWPPATGKVRIDGIALEQFGPDVLGRYVGYLPQDVVLFDGTVAENIARLDETPDSEAVVKAARAANVHDMVLKLPKGYDTQLSTALSMLSGGQKQRIGLARALYGDPILLVLDEPNSNLDNDGSIALNEAVRKMKATGGAVIIIAHRPAAIGECDQIMIIENGLQRAYGPRDEVLKEQLKNFDQLKGHLNEKPKATVQ
ncbi:type I secretion system permease/ATPase [Paracoccaceae bacterium GXU_MW_L88]